MSPSRCLHPLTRSPRAARAKAGAHAVRLLATLLAAGAGMAVSPALAADVTWTGGGANTNWNTAGNWGGTAPVDGDALIFDGSTGTSTKNDFAAGTTFAGITFASGAGAFTLAGTSWGQNGITLTGAIVNQSANVQTITLPIALNSIQTFDTGSAGLVIGDRDSGVISGAGGLTKTGSGTLTLNQTNTYTGATTIEEGTLLLSGSGKGQLSASTAVTVDAGAFFDLGLYSSSAGSIAGAGTIKGGNVVLTLGGNNASTVFSGNITHTGSIVKNGTGTLTLSGTNTYGVTTINAGTVVFQKTSAKGTGTVTATAAGSVGLGVGGTGDYSAANVAALFTNTLAGFSLATGSGVAIDTTAGDFTQGTALTAARMLTKLGAHTLTLTTANTYSGGTRIEAGTVLAENTGGSALGTGDATVGDGARLDGNGFIDAFTTIEAGGGLGTGETPGTLTFTNGLAFSDGSVLNVSLGSAADMIRVTGGTLSASGTVTVNLFAGEGFTAGTYTLIDAAGATLSSIGATTFDVGTTIDGYTVTFTEGDNNTIELVVASAIPEPSTCAALAGFGALALVAIRRFRRRRAP